MRSGEATVSVLCLPIELDQAIRRHCMRDYPNEACGALGGKREQNGWQITAHREALNLWTELGLEPDDPASLQQRFAIDPKWILNVEKGFRDENSELIGFYHSHPDHPARPSETDRRYLWPRVVQMICSVRRGRADDLAAWYADQDEGPFSPVSIRLL